MTNAFSGTVAATWRRRHVGVTLIELLVTLTVMGVFAAIAIPSMQSFIVNSRMRTAGNDFMLAIQRARAESMAQNQCVVLCKSSTQTSNGNPRCDTTDDNWAVGWVAYRLPSCLDSDKPNSATEADDFADAGRMVFTQDALNTNMRIMTVGTATRSMVFSPRGIMTLSGAGRFNVSDNSATSAQKDQYGRTVCVDKMGRARSLKFASSC